jgi:hypothetical protein
LGAVEKGTLIFYKPIADVSAQLLDEGGNLYFEIHKNFGVDVN